MHAFWMDVLQAAAVYALLTLLQVALRRVRPVHAIRYPLNLLFVFAVISVMLGGRLQAVHPSLRTGVETAFFGLMAYVGIRLLDVGLFDVLLGRRMATPVPVVVRDIFKWILFGLSIFLILRTLFPNLNLSVLAFSSIVVGYILGNASQDTLGNLIAGLALNTERPFAIGDWVQLGEYSGRVVDMTWRATRLQTKMLDHIIIPNSTIAREPITNYSRPTLSHGFTLEIGVNYDVPPNKVRAVLIAACDSMTDILEHPRPQVWLHKYDDFSINYTLKFFITDFERLETIQSNVMNVIWYYFKREGIVIPFPIRDVRPFDVMAERAARDAEREADANRALLATIPILQPLSDAERECVAGGLSEDIYGDGEVLVHEGTTGHTFYIVKQGRVRVKVGSKPQREVATLGEGDFFGEMCLLTGEKRNATIVADGDVRVLVITHDCLRAVIEKNTALAEALAKALEARQRSRDDACAALPAEAPVDPPVKTQDLLRRIRAFFRL